MTKRTFTQYDRRKLVDYLANHELPRGLGDKDSACSIAAINLTLTGELTDDIPACMSEVLGRSTIALQDAMPHVLRNSERYKRLLPDMAGTGRNNEKERRKVITEWIWDVVLPQLQPIADKQGFGSEWKRMCEEKIVAARADAADDAADAAYAAARAAARAAADAATYASAATYAALADAAADAADAADAARADAAAAARAAARAATYAEGAGQSDFWKKVDAIGVLERMTYLEKHND